AASAQRQSSPNGLCHVNINIAPRLIEAGESALVFGRVRCGRGSPKASAGRTVRLLQRAAGTRDFRLAQTTTTDAHGFYELVGSGIELHSGLYARSHGALSATRFVKVLAHVALLGPPDGSQILTG